MILSFSFICSLCTPQVSAGQAGVGVLNVPPKYGNIRIVQQDTLLRLYLVISDYNSWGDIYTVAITLEDYGARVAEFAFKQYDNAESYNQINQFTEPYGGKQLLVREKCSYFHSDSVITVDNRCDLELLFVFQTTHFTRLNVLISDRGGLTCEAHIDYNAAEIIRDSHILLIPWFDGTLSLALPASMTNLISIAVAAVGTLIVMKKTNKRIVHQSGYEKG
jgi:hypothetical protein